MRISFLDTKYDSDRLPKIEVIWRKNIPEIKDLRCSSNISILFEYLFSLSEKTEEYVYMLCLNTALKPIGIFEISHGTVDLSVCNPREVFMKALLVGATSIIIVHNHPSGDNKPGDVDLKAVKRLIECGELMKVPLLDSIIMGDARETGAYSMRANLPIIFEKKEKKDE